MSGAGRTSTSAGHEAADSLAGQIIHSIAWSRLQNRWPIRSLHTCRLGRKCEARKLPLLLKSGYQPASLYWYLSDQICWLLCRLYSAEDTEGFQGSACNEACQKLLCCDRACFFIMSDLSAQWKSVTWHASVESAAEYHCFRTTQQPWLTARNSFRHMQHSCIHHALLLLKLATALAGQASPNLCGPLET